MRVTYGTTILGYSTNSISPIGKEFSGDSYEVVEKQVEDYIKGNSKAYEYFREYDSFCFIDSKEEEASILIPLLKDIIKVVYILHYRELGSKRELEVALKDKDLFEDFRKFLKEDDRYLSSSVEITCKTIFYNGLHHNTIMR